MRFKEMREQIEKDFGKRCKRYDSLCCVCRIWEAYDIMAQLYDVKNWMKRKRKFDGAKDETNRN